MKLKFLRCLSLGIMLLVSGLFSMNAGAQKSGGVSGTVTDQSGAPLPGVTVMVKNTSNGTASDSNGDWSLRNVPSDAVLVFDCLGYQQVSQTVSGRSVVNVQMTVSSEFLDDVVVIGYGTMEKKMVTSAISSIGGDQLMPGAGSATLANALRGKVGSLVIAGTDSPNAGTTIQLRGMASVNAGKGPLVVIDGMPGGDIRSVLPEDVLSIDVLKDASAGAIYGTRAAGGVILITTRNANRLDEGTVRMTYTGEISHKTVQKSPDVLNAKEYLSLRADEGAVDYGSDFDWYDAMINNDNFSHKHTLALQANTKVASVYASFQYNSNEGIAINDNREDYAGRITSTFRLLKGWLDVTPRLEYRQARRNDNAPNFAQAVRNNPTRSAFDPESETGYNVWQNETLEYNTIANSALYDYDGLDKWFMPEVSAKLNVLAVPGLSYTQNVGYECRQWELHTFRSKYHQTELDNNRQGTGYLGFSKTVNLNVEGYANYDRNFGEHHISGTAGYSYYEHNAESFSMTNYDFPVEGVKYWNMGSGTYLKTGQAGMASNKDVTQKLFSVFARANYDYANRYIFSASLRRESSSKFNENHRWGTFWSVSGGWRISNERFMESASSWLNDLKLRVAYGVTGNNNFSDSYGALAYSTDGYFMMPNSGKYLIVYGPSINLNPDLRWEEQHGLNIGLDFAFLDNRIYGKFDWYNRKVVDMLYSVQVAQPPYAKTTMMQNIGSMRNRGWEFEIGADVVRNKDWRYSTNLILSHDKTKIVTLYDNTTYFESADFPAPGSPGSAIRIEEGTTIGQFHILKCAGIDKETGDFLIERPVLDENGNVTGSEIIQGAESKASDKQYTGNYIPKIMASWTHRLGWKNLDFSMDIRSWIDFDVYNTLDMYYGLRSQGGTNTLHSAYGKNKDITAEKKLCDYFLEDGTFLKIDAVNLGYTFPLKEKTNSFLNNIRVYASVNNLCTLTKYTGMDPEVDITGYDGGIEWWSSSFYPRTRSYILGLQINF